MLDVKTALSQMRDTYEVKRAAQNADRTPWRSIARPEQLRPEGVLHWLFMAGRGAGKTRSVTERLRERLVEGKAKHIALIGRTFSECRDVLVEGESGILAVCGDLIKHNGYNRSIGEIYFKSGAKAKMFSAEEPDKFRGYQTTDIIGDELGSWKYAEEAFQNLMFGLRLGEPEANWATTPRPGNPVIKKLKDSASCAITNGSTYDNRQNLAESFLTETLAMYEGTRAGRQEIYGELLEDAPGALWNTDLIDPYRVKEIPELIYKVVAVDPAVSNNPETSDLCGIIAAGLAEDGHVYVLGDFSGHYSPNMMAKKVGRLADYLEANAVVYEENQGGLFVKEVLKQEIVGTPIKSVRACQGKKTRAEPVVGKYEQGYVHHRVITKEDGTPFNPFKALEDQLLTWEPEGTRKSPDRLDALVYAVTHLIQRSKKVGDAVRRYTHGTETEEESWEDFLSPGEVGSLTLS